MPKRIPENLELSDGVWSLNVEPLNFELPRGSRIARYRREEGYSTRSL